MALHAQKSATNQSESANGSWLAQPNPTFLLNFFHQIPFLPPFSFINYSFFFQHIFICDSNLSISNVLRNSTYT